MKELDESFESVQVSNFEDEKEKKIEEICEKLEENPEENLKKILFQRINKKDITEALINKTLDIYKKFKLNEKDNGIDIIKSFFNEALQFSRFNFSSRLIDFFDFITSNSDLKLEYLEKALEINSKNLGQDNNTDIIFFWKECIAKEKLSEGGIMVNTNQMKSCLNLLLKNNFNVNQIYYVFLLFRKIMLNDKFNQLEILNSLINTLILYPKYLDEENEGKRILKEKDLQVFIDKYIIKIDGNNNPNSNNYIFDEKKNIALDFYLKISGDKSSNESLELNVQEIFHYLKINNPDISHNLINIIDEQLKGIHSTIENNIYKKYDKTKFQNWTKTELQNLKTYNINKCTSRILGMISLAIYNIRKYYLRNTQLIAILLFIYKESKKGLIEEISTGEGKSCIISSLSIYYALMGHMVDIISSSYTLAQRDSEEFKELYSYFNLTTGYPYDSNTEPYRANILYGTFLEFEGDYLREITTNANIRDKRPYDVIIIDEVDNLFVDNILGSTRLTNSSRGYKFLIPIYIAIYLCFELSDYFFMLFFRISLNKLNLNPETKKKFERIIKDPKERKKEIIKIIEHDLDYIFDFKDKEGKKDKKARNNIDNNIDDNIDFSERDEEAFDKIEDASDDYLDYIEKLQTYLKFPEFLEKFVEVASQFWLDSAYDAKNLMEIDRDYVEVTNRYGNRDISPVDRTNTGEIELSTVYDGGLHQMLEIKHKLRVRDETSTHTFLSHITFFQKYKKRNEFLFFGLTGTIGDEETQKIYGNQYFDSKILFIPQYKKKRFVELPPLLVNVNNHYNTIYKDIIINFYKGRKILVICNSIKESKIIEFNLKSQSLIKNFGISKNILAKEDYRDSIILYTRSDTEKTNIKKKNKRIILSTNLGGRGTDIQTTPEEEEKGGLHVILTYLPKNYRVLKQAFGRTSREGKKGTGQIILKNMGYQSYSDVKKEMSNNEKRHISHIQKKLRILLFEDKLFEEFINTIKDIDFKGYLIEDINERWALFLKMNVTSKSEKELNMDEVAKKFEEFKIEIKNIIDGKEIYKKFENPFYQMGEGLKRFENYERGLMNFFNFESKENKFYFTQPYIKAIIIIKNNSNYDDKFFTDVIINLDEAKKRLILVIKENINPVINSFEQWEIAMNNFESAFQSSDNFRSFAGSGEQISESCFKKSDLCIQYTNIREVCFKIIEKIEENKKVVEDFQKKCKKSKDYVLRAEEEELEDGLNLKKELLKEKSFFTDASFKNVFKLTIFHRKINLKSSFWKLLFIGVIGFLIFLISNYFALAVAVGIVTYTIAKGVIQFVNGVEISLNSLFGNIFPLMLKEVKKKTDKKSKIAVQINPFKQSEIVKSTKNILLNKIIEHIEIKFDKIEKSASILNFLIFVDYYYSEETWSEKIKLIFKENFDKIYKTEFYKNDYFGTPITNESFNEHLSKYNSLFDKYLNTCIKEINNLGNPKQFNKKDGLNCLEHLIKDLNSEKISDDIANKTVQKILEYQLLSENGIINKKLFKKYFVDEQGEKLEQKINIHLTSKIINKSLIKNITDLKDFRISGFEIPLVNSSFIDLANFYHANNYNLLQIQQNFSLYILNNLKHIILYLLNMKPNILLNFYRHSLNYIKSMVKNLLEEKIFSEYNKSTFENVISAELTDEERVEFRKLIQEASKQAANIKHKKIMD